MQQHYDRYVEKIKRLRLIDDTLMSVVLSERSCTEFVLRLVLANDNLIVDEVQTQNSLQNLRGRGIRFDVTARDENGTLYNIEIQRADSGAIPKRARFNSGMLDANYSEVGQKHFKLPETYVIFITEKDVLGHGFPLYHIERVIQETGELFDDKAHIIYVNGEYVGEDPIGKLMHDFRCADVDDMHYTLLADETRRYKEEPKGVRDVCKIMEEVHNEGRIEAFAEMIKIQVEDTGLTIKEAMDKLRVPDDIRSAVLEYIQNLEP